MSSERGLSKTTGQSFHDNLKREESGAAATEHATKALFSALRDTRMHLHRTHEGMQHLMARCEAVGQAMERCAEALANIPASPGSSFASAGATTATAATAAAFSDRSSVSAVATTSHRQLYWSLSQYHTHVAQLLSAASMRAYDAAVTDKIDHRLRLMERSAATLHRCVAGDGDGGAAAVAGSAGQLEQLACTRFAPAYKGFLLYAVATLGDFCALWDAATQRSAKEVVWSSSLEGASTMAVPLHAEHHITMPTRTPSQAVSGEPSRPHRNHSTSLSSSFVTVMRAVEDLRDSFFDYLQLLHGTIRAFCAAAQALLSTLSRVLPLSAEANALHAAVSRVEQGASLLDGAQLRWRTRQRCYETVLEETVLSPLRALQHESKQESPLDCIVGRKGYDPHCRRGSRLLGRAVDFFGEANTCRSSGVSGKSRCLTGPPSDAVDVLAGTWFQLVGVFQRLGSEMSVELVKEVNV